MSQKPDAPYKRHPIKNFILLPELQWPYIIRILALVNLSGVLMATAVCVLFYLRRQSHEAASLDLGADVVNQNLAGMLAEKSLLEVMVPAFIIADVVSLIIGLVLSLYFSRKISVPLYRLQKWAEVIVSGDLSFRLKFRPGDDLQGIEEACNRVSVKYCDIIEDLRRQVSEQEGSAASKLENLQASLSRIKT